MNDLIEQVRASVPDPGPLDLEAVHGRAMAIRRAEEARRRRLFTAIAAGLVALLVVALPWLLRGDADTAVISPPGEGASALDEVHGPSVDGTGEVTLAGLVDGPAVVVVWAPWCGPCVDMLPDLAAYAAGADAVPVVTVAIQSDLPTVQEALAEAAPTVPGMLADDAAAVWGLADATAAREAVPTTLSINAAGEVVKVVLGPIDALALRSAGDAARTGTEPATSATEVMDSVTPVTGPSEPPPCPVTAGVATGQVYVVQHDAEPLSAIAAEVYGDPGQAGIIAEANGISEDVVLCLGQELVIPPASGTPDPGSVQVYVVQPGDTLSGISEAVYGTPHLFGLIAELNDIGELNPLYVGQELAIPDPPADPPAGAQGSGQAAPLPDGPFDPRVAAALADTAPAGWVTVEATELEEHWAGQGAQVRYTTPPAPAGGAWAAVQAELAAGAAPVELADGAVGALAGSPATGWRLLVPLPGERLLQADAPVGTDGFSDYDASSFLFGWATDVRAALGQ